MLAPVGTRSRPVNRARGAAAVVLAAVLAGCGETTPTYEQQVVSTLTRFDRATAQRDYRTICDELLTPELLEDIRSVGLPCAVALREALEEVRDPSMSVGQVAITGPRATADVRTSATGQAPSSDVVQLVRVDGGWRIAALGAAVGGRPPG